MGSPLDNPGIKTNQPNNQRYIMKVLKLEKTYLNLDHVRMFKDTSSHGTVRFQVYWHLDYTTFHHEDAEIIRDWVRENSVNGQDEYEAVHDYDAPSMQEIKLAATEAAEYGHSLESVKAIPDEGDSVWLERGISEVTKRTSGYSKDPEEVVILLHCMRPTPVKGISDLDQ